MLLELLLRFFLRLLDDGGHDPISGKPSTYINIHWSSNENTNNNNATTVAATTTRCSATTTSNGVSLERHLTLVSRKDIHCFLHSWAQVLSIFLASVVVAADVAVVGVTVAAVAVVVVVHCCCFCCGCCCEH